MRARVRHRARLLPPLRGVAERFLAASSAAKLRALRDCLVASGVAVEA